MHVHSSRLAPRVCVVVCVCVCVCVCHVCGGRHVLPNVEVVAHGGERCKTIAVPTQRPKTKSGEVRNQAKLRPIATLKVKHVQSIDQNGCQPARVCTHTALQPSGSRGAKTATDQIDGMIAGHGDGRSWDVCDCTCERHACASVQI